MLHYYPATIVDFQALLTLIMEFELDKNLNYDHEVVVEKAKLLKDNKKNLKLFLNDDTYRYLLCKKDNKLIGYIFMSFGDIYVGEGYINEVYVIPEERRNGISKLLLNQAIDWLKFQNCKTIDITVNRNNKVALTLYKNYGFDVFEDSYIPMRKKI